MKKLSLFCVGLALFIGASCSQKEVKADASTPLVNYVDPFIGTGGHGHTYPGATLPFGMVQASPVNGVSAWDWCSGYHYSDSVVVGFGHLHLSGTGIGDLTDVLLMPTNKKLDLSIVEEKNEQYPQQGDYYRNQLPYKATYTHQNEKASPGYYQVYLNEPKINVELTASERTAFHQYTYPSEGLQSFVVDLGFSMNWDKATQSQLKKIDDYTLSGYRYSTGWAKNQKVFFVIQLSKPIERIDFYADGRPVAKQQAQGKMVSAQVVVSGQQNSILQLSVTLSSVSEQGALQNLKSGGFYKTFDFNTQKEKASKLWEEALSSIEVETPVDSLKTIFYTALYHSQLSPVMFSDTDGSFRLENDSIAKTQGVAYSTFSLWDTFRSQNPLLTIIQPDRVADMVNSMLAYYQVNHRLPVWTLYGNETNTMTGYHSIPVIVEAYLKGIKGFDPEQAFQAMKTTMMQDDRGLSFYKKYGYIPYDKLDESVTITLEYAYDDWCVAQMAKALGKQDDYQYFLKRSKAYEYLFDKQTGFFRGKSSDGKTWREPFDPKHSNHREHTDYTEGNAWQHSWFVPQDVQAFIALHGGEESFVKKLEQLFSESSEITGDNVSADISGLIGQYAHGNEPSHHIAYLFNCASQPKRTQYWVNKILTSQYNTTPNGLSGNEDCGQMSAWFVFSSIGLYPMNPASTQYEITSPLFEKTTIHLPDGKQFVIEAKNLSTENIYIKKAILNGKTLNRTSISHQELMQGGTLSLEMTDK